METLKGTMNITMCGCFAVTDGDIVLRPTNSNFNEGLLVHYFSRLTLFNYNHLTDLYLSIPMEFT